MTEWKTETATVDFRELGLAELAKVGGGLSPQPLPPGAMRYRALFSWVTLNPQPEPPGILFLQVGAL
jgi:hypothetical protein